MKFIRYLQFDLEQGIFRNRALWISPIIIAIITFLDFASKAYKFFYYEVIEEFVSYGDYLFYLYGGMQEYRPELHDAFRFPIVWIVVFLVAPFALLNYPFKDMYGNGQQILVRSGSRMSWWMAKCCWNFLGTFLYHFIILITGIGLCVAFRMNISERIHVDFITLAFEIGFQEIWNPLVLQIMAILLPLFVSASINMLQMTLSLFVKPVFSFLFVCVLLLASAYLLSPTMIGNYAMLYRHDWMLKSGVSVSVGYGICGILLSVSVVLGLVKFRFYDIIEKE